jgi:Domain of unknown function (DUF4190)
MSYPPPPGDPNQPQYNPYPQQPYNYGPPQATGTNGMAIAGFVLSFFCSILGLIFSIVGLNQTKQRRQGGSGLAIAGIVISCLGIVAAIALLAARR